MQSEQFQTLNTEMDRANRGAIISTEGSTPWNGPPLCRTLTIEHKAFSMVLRVTAERSIGEMIREFDCTFGCSISLDMRGIDIVKVEVLQSYVGDTEEQGEAYMIWREGVRNYGHLRLGKQLPGLDFTDCPPGASAIAFADSTSVNWSDGFNLSGDFIPVTPGQLYPVMAGQIWPNDEVWVTWYIEPF